MYLGNDKNKNRLTSFPDGTIARYDKKTGWLKFTCLGEAVKINDEDEVCLGKIDSSTFFNIVYTLADIFDMQLSPKGDMWVFHNKQI
jgi:adenylosuccinate synthase